MTTRYRGEQEEGNSVETLFTQRELRSGFRRGKGLGVDLSNPLVDFVEGDGKVFHEFFKSANPSEEVRALDDYEISYDFPDTERTATMVTYTRIVGGFWNLLNQSYRSQKTSYGSNMSFRRLYEILCSAFNKGEYFVDRYFDTEFHGSDGERLLLETKQRIAERMAGELSQFKRRSLQDAKGRFVKAENMTMTDVEKEYERVFKRIGDFEVWHDKAQYAQLQEAGRVIREHIIFCLRTGSIPLKRTISRATLYRRELANISSDVLFYATGQLINSMDIFIEFKGAA